MEKLSLKKMKKKVSNIHLKVRSNISTHHVHIPTLVKDYLQVLIIVILYLRSILMHLQHYLQIHLLIRIDAMFIKEAIENKNRSEDLRSLDVQNYFQLKDIEILLVSKKIENEFVISISHYIIHFLRKNFMEKNFKSF